MTAKKNINEIYDYFQNDLNIIDKEIIKNCDAKSPLIKEMSIHIINSGGKRIRPILVLLSNMLISGEKNSNIYYLASAVELIHTATLLHDDVVDNSSLRRGSDTANAIWDNKASILVGDFLFSLSFQMMVATNSIKILEILSNASNIIADGEVNQLQNSNNIEITMEKYFEIIEGKTAALFSASCSSGAALANAPIDQINKLHEFGNNLGILFQITDDLMDYGYGSGSLGKNIGDDFNEAKITLPVIIAYQKSSNIDKNKIEDLLFANTANSNKEDDLNSLLKILDKHNSFKNCINIATEYYNNSRNILKLFKPSIYRDYLEIILQNVIERVK